MSKWRSTDEPRGFWAGFAEVLAEEGIPSKQRPYYCRWMEGLFKGTNGLLEREVVESYLASLFKSRSRSEWQVAQAIDAIRLGLCRVGRDRWEAWARQIDWAAWKERSRSLEKVHPTRMRKEYKNAEWLQMEHKWREPHPEEAKAIGATDRLVRDSARNRDFALRTEASYVQWCRRYTRFVYRLLDGAASMRQPDSVGKYLHFLAVVRDVSPATQKQAVNALSFFFKRCLRMEGVDFGEFARARTRQHLPVVMSEDEVSRLLGHMADPWKLAAELMYGSGLRVSECMRLRIKDLDFDRGQIVLRETKGGRERVVPLPDALADRLREAVELAREVHSQDVASGEGWVTLPRALERKYRNAPRSFAWFWLFGVVGFGYSFPKPLTLNPSGPKA